MTYNWKNEISDMAIKIDKKTCTKTRNEITVMTAWLYTVHINKSKISCVELCPLFNTFFNDDI